MNVVYKRECCGYESSQYQIHYVGKIFQGTFRKVKSCNKCNWFLFENKTQREQIMKLWRDE